MSGKGRLDGDFRRFAVTDLPDQNYIRVLPDNRPQSGGKSQINFRIHLNLPDAFHLVLDGILDSNDIDVRLVDRGKSGVQCRGFTAAGRTGHENYPVRRFNESVEQFDPLVMHAQIGQHEHFSRFIQQTQNNSFAEGGGNNGDADIDQAVGNFYFNASVLRQTFFRDIEFGHDFYA